MRIATAQFSQQAIEGIGKRNEALARLQQQLSSGKRVNQPSDDPIAAAEAERIRAAVAESGIEKKMMSFATGMLSAAEGALAAAGEGLQSVRELLIGAGNGSMGPGDRAMIATQLQGLRDELLSIANQRDGSGGFVFGGQGAAAQPFTTAGAPSYTPDPGTRQTGLDQSFDTTVDGARAFLGDGSSTPAGSVFNALDSIITRLNDPAADPATLPAAIGTAIAATDSSLARMQAVRTEVGEQMRAVEARGRLIEAGDLRAASRLEDLTATDYAAAISEMNVHQLAVSAAMQSYSQIARLSLFDYL